MPKRLFLDPRQENTPPGTLYSAFYETGSYYNFIMGEAGSGTVTFGTDTIRLWPIWIDREVSFDRIGIEVTTAQASSNYRAGVYKSDGDGKPGALVVDSGNLDTSTTGGKEATIDITLKGPALYYTCIITNNGSVAVRGHTDNAAFPGMGLTALTGFTEQGVLNISHSFGALPDPAGSATLGGGNLDHHCVMLRVA